MTSAPWSLTAKGHYLPPLQVLPSLRRHFHFGSTYARDLWKTKATIYLTWESYMCRKLDSLVFFYLIYFYISVTHLSNKLVTRSILLWRRIDRESACLMVHATYATSTTLILSIGIITEDSWPIPKLASNGKAEYKHSHIENRTGVGWIYWAEKETRGWLNIEQK